ncbi:endonuclease/exonuclease/phosphatase family protein [Muriicola sp. Z0-33]|uniref:endonuclease/exonuclease/phosphatase family protein n=1 Tax=Muriicola sp. Z0-33 TaxID=2816957 RepID=UPI0022386747|nr:endonuclease/exonuclease/phosphatase family protein [Muriicola sp. Z0-33]MCW5515819.1 endonuclease/exonuclease/phosphatase family protein [Muriicola sp. Z0-33]
MCLLLISCVLFYFPLDSFPFLHLISLGVPVLVIVNLIFLLYWIIRRKLISVVPIIVLVIGYFVFGPFFKLPFNGDSRDLNDLSIMSFNTRAFNKYDWIDKPEIGDEIIAFVTEQDPDVVCFQEFQSSRYKEFSQYPYRYMNYIFPENKSHVVQAIFSKLPIVDKGSLDFPNTGNNAIYADVIYKQDTLRVYNLHLESLKLDVNKAELTNKYSGKFMERIQISFSKQREQAELLKVHSNTSDHKKLLLGDFNNTQFSNVYKTIKGDLTDTFIARGTAYGRTHTFKYFPVRIDFIMVDPSFEVLSHKNFDLELSDHLPIMASIRLSHQETVD